MKKYNMISNINIAAVAASTLALTSLAANAATTVWNVNVGRLAPDLMGYQGAATENPATGSSWNAVTSAGMVTLNDSAGSNAAGVTLTISPTGGSSLDLGITGVTGDDIFESWIKDVGNDDPITVSFGNLGAGTYDLIVYSDWFFQKSSSLPVTQTAGSGLTGTFNISSEDGANHTDGIVGPLLEDTDPTISRTSAATNYARFRGLTADGSNNLTFSMGGVNAPINGFQLVQIPEPSSTVFLGLGGLALIFRRRN